MKVLWRSLALAGLAALGACDIVPSRYRARLTVEVQTPQGVRTGSGTVEIQAGKTLALLPDEGRAQVELRGEAVAVDLTGGDTLFMLLGETKSGDSLEQAITSALIPDFRSGAEGFLEAVPRLGETQAIGRTAVLDPRSYPRLVRFRDEADPKSVELAEPDRIDLGVRGKATVRRITVEVTDGAVTSGIEKRLPWLGTSVKGYLDGAFAKNSSSLANQLDTREFKR